MDITYKEDDTFNNSLTKLSSEINNENVDETVLFRTDSSLSITQLDSIILSFDQYDKKEKLIIEILVALNIDIFVKDLNIYNHVSFSNLFLFAKNHSIDFQEDYVLDFYFANSSVLLEENSKSSLYLFIQLLQNNIELIDDDKLIIIFNLFELMSFEIKNDLIFIIANSYLIKTSIYSIIYSYNWRFSLRILFITEASNNSSISNYNWEICFYTLFIIKANHNSIIKNFNWELCFR